MTNTYCSSWWNSVFDSFPLHSAVTYLPQNRGKCNGSWEDSPRRRGIFVLGLCFLLQVYYLDVESKAKLWSRTPCCLWLAWCIQVSITLSLTLLQQILLLCLPCCVLPHISPLISSSPTASFFLGPLHILITFSVWTWGRTSFLWGWRSPGTGCPGRLWSLFLWRYSRPAWTRSSTACCRWPCFNRRVGLDDPQRSLPTPTILWFLLFWDSSFLLHLKE